MLLEQETNKLSNYVDKRLLNTFPCGCIVRFLICYYTAR